MKKIILIIMTVMGLTFGLSGCAGEDAKVEKIYIFGDSLSDNGNFFYVINHLIGQHNIRLQSPPASYGGEKFSDKFLLTEYLGIYYGVSIIPAWGVFNSSNFTNNLSAEENGNLVLKKGVFTDKEDTDISATQEETVKDFMKSISLEKKVEGNNYAFANSTIGNYDGLVNDFFDLFNLTKQVDLHFRTTDSASISSGTTLHMMMIGGNDIMNVVISKETPTQQENDIKNLVDDYVTQIIRLRDQGAKKILVSTAPEIGEIPAFVNSGDRAQANHLTDLLETELQKKISDEFSTSEVRYVSLTTIFNKIKGNWSPQRQTQACISDIIDGYFDLSHFIESDGELPTKYVNGCDQSALNNGEFMFFDYFHGTDAVYRKTAVYYISEINQLMGGDGVKYY